MAEYPVIQGDTPDSWQEVYLAQAMDKLGVRYKFHEAIYRPVGKRGSIIVDFVVYIPFATPVEVMGAYWHSGAMGSDDAMKLIIERVHYGREPIVIDAKEIETPDLAEQYVKREFA